MTGDKFIVGPNTAGREGYIFEQTFSNPIGTNSILSIIGAGSLSLIDNLLMNGIEACEDIGGKREVGIVIRKENGVVEIEAENTIKQSVFSTNPEMVSTKKDSHRHGFGLDTIRKIVEIYDGQYSFWEDQGEDSLWFVQNIYLNIPKTV